MEDEALDERGNWFQVDTDWMELVWLVMGYPCCRYCLWLNSYGLDKLYRVSTKNNVGCKVLVQVLVNEIETREWKLRAEHWI